MRDILFRGKAIGGLNACRWIYGYYVKDFWTPSSVGHGIIPADRDIGGYCEVYPDTVGQYTGLKDKNGKMIFEGDIVAGAVHWLERMKNGVVAFRCGSFGLIWHRGDVEQFNPFTSMCNVEYEVIGNIHDNPETFEGRC